MKIKRSYIVGIVIFVTYFVAWLDRQAIAMAIPSMQKDMNLDSIHIGWITSAFFLGYSIFQIPGGIWADKFGPRKVILVALVWWSIFTSATGFVAEPWFHRSVLTGLLGVNDLMLGGLVAMLPVRACFGIGEGVFPPCLWKVIGGWFTKKNRATVNALILSMVALGPGLSSIILAPLIAAWGWKASFYFLGLLGLLCLALMYLWVGDSIESDKAVPAEELAEYRADSASALANVEVTLEETGFMDLLKTPVIWVLFFVGLTANICMYGWLQWLPKYLIAVKHLDMKALAWAASLPFLAGAVGCSVAGYISDRWFRGRRKYLVFACQLVGLVSLFLFTRVSDPVYYTILQCVAGFFLFMVTGALWALPVNLVPPKVMGAGSGLINTGGQIGGFITGILIGYYISWHNGDYARMFDIMLGGLALSALIVLFGIHEKTRKLPA